MSFFKKLVVYILTLEARIILRKYKPFIIAVTGSVGKTSTKDAIYSVIKNSSHFARKSDKSMNSEIGLPLTVLGVPNAWRSASGWISNILTGLKLIFGKNEYPDCLILEVGADHPGDIRRSARLLRPDIAVITRVSAVPVHVEFFESPEQVFEEKAFLAQYTKKGGSVILFADDERVMGIAERVREKDVKVVSFGMNEKADVRGSEDVIDYELGLPVGMSCKISFDGSSIPVKQKGIIGRAYMYPLLAAAAVGKVRGMSVDAIGQGLAAYDAPKGRMNIIPGVNGSTLIDDTYNSSPDAVVAALNTLKEVKTKGQRIAILGDMMELGKYSGDEHRKVGTEVVEVASRLITVGQRSRATAETARKNGMSAETVRSVDTAREAGEFGLTVVKQGDVVLIKGSQSVRMERTVALLMREPQRATELLVRQEKDWLDKA